MASLFATPPQPAFVSYSSWAALAHPAALGYGQSPHGGGDGSFNNRAPLRFSSHGAPAAVDYGQSSYAAGHSQGGHGQTGPSHGRQYAQLGDKIQWVDLLALVLLMREFVFPSTFARLLIQKNSQPPNGLGQSKQKPNKRNFSSRFFTTGGVVALHATGHLCTAWTRGCCVPPKRGRKRTASARGEVRLKMATAEPARGRPNHRKSYAMPCGWATWGSFFCFFEGFE